MRFFEIEWQSNCQKVVRTPCVFNIFTFKCVASHDDVHFFNISTSKSRPNPTCFDTFYFQMCFAPQRRALFRHRNFQKWSEMIFSLRIFSLPELLPGRAFPSFHIVGSLASKLPSIMYIYYCTDIMHTRPYLYHTSQAPSAASTLSPPAAHLPHGKGRAERCGRHLLVTETWVAWYNEGWGV